MAKMIRLIIQCFGSMRQYGDENHQIILQVPHGASVQMIKTALKKQFQTQPHEQIGKMIDHSALADEHRIFSAEEVITKSGQLAILPPVCGG